MAGWGTDRDPVGFWTILFAVAGGVLLADLVRVLLAAILAHAALSALSDSVGKTRVTAPSHVSAPPSRVEVGRDQDVLPRLPGPITSQATGSSWACISGYIADRSSGGWIQRSPLESCTANSE
jgi:hypothetical protein